MNDFRKQNQTEDRQVKKLVRKVLIPNFTAEISLAATSVVDGVVVGNFYGSHGLAAVGLGGPIFSVFTIIAGLLATGNSVLCSRMIGQSTRTRCNRIFSLAVIWAAFLSVVMTALTVGGAETVACMFSGNAEENLLSDVAAYIRGFSLGAPFIIFRQLLMPMVNIEGGNRHIHISSFLILASDALLDFIFSAWFDGGTFGLGAASALSYLFGCLPLFVFFIRKKSALKIDFRNSFSWKETLEIFQSGFPTAVKRLCNVITPVLTNRFILSISSVGAVAALSVQASSTRGVTLSLVLALSSTFLLVTGTAYGEGDRKQMEACVREMLFQAFWWSVGISAFFIVFSQPLAQIFIQGEQDVTGMSVGAIRWYAVGVPFMAINQCTASYLQATKKLKASNWIIIADRMISIVIMVYLLGWLFGEKGVFAAYGLSEVLLTLFLYILLCIKNRGPVTRLDQILLLPESFGVSDRKYLSASFRSGDDVTDFSIQVQEFCKVHGVDRRRSVFAALCIEELAVNVLTYGLVQDSQSLTVRVFLYDDEMLEIRLRDDGIPFDLEKRWKLVEKDNDDPAANVGIRLVFGLAGDVTYLSTYGMNNIIITL